MKSGLPKTATECTTLAELGEARAAWWSLAERYDAALKYSSSCLTDIQARDEAHSNWKQCDAAYFELLAVQGRSKSL